jgi:enoyl-CoA hydratase/carnithine racemase
MPQVVLTEQTGRVLTVRLDDPPRNFLGSRMVAEFDDLTRRLERDRSVGAVILTSAVSDVFVTHADTREISRRAKAAGWAPTYRQARALAAVAGPIGRIPPARRVLERTPLAGVVSLRRAYDVFARMNRLDKVFIAAIDGLALGGGFILALACDIRLIADSDHRIGLPEGALGFIAAAGGTQRCARLIGPGRALDLLLDGRLLRPDEAAEIGLVNRAVPAAELLPAAEELAERLARRSPLAVREIKRCIYDGGSRRFTDGLRVEEASMLATVSTPASLRALDAYHAELGPMDATGNDDVTAAWERLRDGTLVDVTAP